MKRIFLITAAAVLMTGCSKKQDVENKPVNAANSSTQQAATPETAVPKANISSPSTARGEKIVKAITVKFEPNRMPDGWSWIDPDSQLAPSPHDTKDGVLKITIPSGKDLYGENRTAPRLLKAIDGDFQIETRIKFDPTKDYQGAGLLIFLDNNSYIRLERAFGGVGGGESGIRLDVRVNDEYRPLSTPGDVPTMANVVDLKLLRKGKNFIAFWREDENGEWKEVGEYASDYPGTVQAGLIGCNTASEIKVEFAYIKLAPAVN